MRHHLNRFVSFARPWLNDMPRYAFTGAWFFAVASAIPLFWLMIEGHGDSGTSRVFGTQINGVVHTVWGLAYSGFFGSLLLWLEFFALIAATVIAALPAGFRFAPAELTTRMRRIGLGYLTGWAGLWMIGTMYLASVAPGFWTIQALFIAGLFGCTLYRAMRQWNANPPAVQAESIQVQARPEQIATPTHSPLTDIADISRFMLHRSAVRNSDRVNEREVEQHLPPSRLFADSKRSAHTALDDDYGAQLRHTIRRAMTWVKAKAKKVVALVLPNHPRQPVEIDIPPAENHTDAFRFRRV